MNDYLPKPMQIDAYQVSNLRQMTFSVISGLTNFESLRSEKPQTE